MLIFVLQAIWLYIKELAGKDLDILTVLKFLFYITPTLIPLILPLTILLSSIMVFGNFAENYEFAAMKSTGISLQRAMSSLSVFIVLLAITTFFFSNNVIPWAEYNSYNLRKNIAKVKPAMAIAEGQFNQIGENFNIKVAKKTGERGQFLEDVVIHQSQKGKPGNHKTTIAKTGELISSKKSDVLQLVLFDGYHYDDTPPKDYKKRLRRPFTKSSFDKYIMNIDLSQLNTVDLSQKNIDDKYTMLSINELNYAIDSLNTQRQNLYATNAKSLYDRTNIGTLNLTVEPRKDTIYSGHDILSLFKTKRQVQLLDYAVNASSSTIQIITSKQNTIKARTIWFNKHIIAFHEKFALAIACIILFFVGAPLGALIKKGGLGLPMVIAIVLFLSYHFIGIFAKNSAKDGSFNPAMATWFSTLIMLPLSIYLTTRATKDKGAFETDSILEPLKKLFGVKQKTVSESETLLATNSNAYTTLEGYDNNKLIDVIKNYREYDYSIAYKNSSVAILETRGITAQELKIGGHFTNQKYEEAVRLKHMYDEDSKLSLILYAIAVPLILLGSILKNNTFPLIGNILFVTGIVIEVLFLFSFMKSFNSFSNLTKQLDKSAIGGALIFLLFGIPLYMVNYFIQSKQIAKELKMKPVSLKESTHNKPVIENTEKITTSNVLVSKTKLKDYKTVATFSYIFYGFAVILFILYFVLNNNKPLLAPATLQLCLISFIIYIVHYVKSYFSFSKLYYNIEDLTAPKKPLLLIVGFIIYPIIHLFRNRKIESDFKH